jgi:hypothetical protein
MLTVYLENGLVMLEFLLTVEDLCNTIEMHDTLIASLAKGESCTARL